MKKLFIAILLFLVLPGWGFGYTETFYVCEGGDGTLPETDACATAWDIDDLNSSGNLDIDDADDGNVGPNDIVYFKDDGGVFQNTDIYRLTPGLNGKPITFKAYPGDTPIIDNSEIIIGWANHVGNIYKVAIDSAFLDSVAAEPQGFVMVDNTYDSDHWPEPVENIGSIIPVPVHNCHVANLE